MFPNCQRILILQAGQGHPKSEASGTPLDALGPSQPCLYRTGLQRKRGGGTIATSFSAASLEAIPHLPYLFLLCSLKKWGEVRWGLLVVSLIMLSRDPEWADIPPATLAGKERPHDCPSWLLLPQLLHHEVFLFPPSRAPFAWRPTEAHCFSCATQDVLLEQS